MKFICMMFFIFSMAFNLNAQTDSELMRALNYGANADIKILVKDQDGEPVKNAIIKAAFLCDYSSGGKNERIRLSKLYRVFLREAPRGKNEAP